MVRLARLPLPMKQLRRQWQMNHALNAILLTLLLSVSGVSAATHPGTKIDNSARIDFETSNSMVTRLSNLVSIITVGNRTPSTLDFLRYASSDPGAVPTLLQLTDGGTPLTALPAPTPFNGDPLATGVKHPLAPTTVYHIAEPIFLQLTDLDQNLDANVIETIFLTVTSPQTDDSEVIRLYETGVSSGVFVGYLASSDSASAANNGTLSVVVGGNVEVRYVDDVDNSDIRLDAALIDPFGRVFDSRTGLPVNGATVTLINVATGNPALVYGDDGISIYQPDPTDPTRSTATVNSGGGASDSNGMSYTFPAGGFRFPFAPPGNYRLEITPPAGYSAPSVIATSELQTLPGAPFAIVTGSRGEVFVISPGPNLQIDIPLDHPATALWLQKSSAKSVGGIGDFIPYELVVENSDAALVAMTVTVNDRLPAGFRYRPGSTRIDGVVAADPEVAPNGRTLTFALGNLAPQAQRRISYIAAVGTGARPGPAINTATATDLAGAVSNSASATIAIREELIHSRSFLAGRVLNGSCDSDEQSSEGLKGIRVFLEDGTYTITDEEGRYHFEGISPERHVVQLDLDSLPVMYEMLSCEENTRFAGRNFSQFVDIQPGTLWRTDFHVGLRPRASGDVTLELNGAISDDQAYFTLPLTIGGVALSNLRLTIILPEGLEYLPGTSQLDGAAIVDPSATGQTATYRLGDQAAGWRGAIRLSTRVNSKHVGELVTRAILTFDSPEKKNQRTPLVENILQVTTEEKTDPLPDFTVRPRFPSFVAELSEVDRRTIGAIASELQGYQISRLVAIGHTDNVRISRRGQVTFADNYVLAKARATAVANYFATLLHLAPEQVDTFGRADTESIADNASEEGRALNRRVEIRIEGGRANRTVDIELLKDKSGPARSETVGLRPGEKAVTTVDVITTPSDTMPTFDAAWFEKQTPELTWLWPRPGKVPAIASIKIAIKHPPELTPTLLLEGQKINLLAFDGTVRNPAGTMVISLWRGVSLTGGDNHFEVVFKDAQGNEVQHLRQDIHYSFAPVRAELVEEESLLVADGRTPPVIAVRLVDKDGYPACEGIVGEMQISPPYRPWFVDASEATALAQKKPKFRVGADGIARIVLEPTTQSGDAILNLALKDGNAEIRAWMQPQPREWILVGLAEGTAGYNIASGNMESLEDHEQQDDFYRDSRVAFFAKGKIKGSWLLTMAYDSDKARQESLFQTINPDSYYTLYGDSTTQQYEAASARKLYLKIERGQFYALFGDFDSGLTVTELSRYSRSFNGFKSEFKGSRGGWNVFAADSHQSFVKDEIPGDGTSGLYRLTRSNIVLNSEKIVIETRDRFHSEIVLTSRILSRYIDYNIDYELGTIYFKEPVTTRDGTFNPNIIVIDYEAADSSDNTMTYGGRATVKPFGDPLELGASLVHEGTTGATGNLYGVDTTVKIDPRTTLKGEYATSKVNGIFNDRQGDAWLAELSHQGSALNTRAYYREQEPGFGLGQQPASEGGMRKTGIDSSYQMTPQVTISGAVARQTNLTTGDEGDLAEGNIAYKDKTFNLSTGLRQAIDHVGSGDRNESIQALFGAGWQANSRLAFHLNREQSLGSSDGAADYPTRTILGADYRLTEAVTLFGEQEWTKGASEESEGSRLGLKTTPWSGAQANSSVEQQINEAGTRVFANLGLKQTWQLSKHFSLDAGLDRSQTLHHPGNIRVNPAASPASGSDSDYTAVSVGANWMEEKWSWFNRAEYRTSESEDKWGGSVGAMGEVSKGVGLSANLQFFLTDSSTGAQSTNSDVRFGLAWRPANSRWIVLDRLELLNDRQTGTTTDLDSWRIINNLHANIKVNRRTQVALQYALKYVQETISGADFSGYTDLSGCEGRFDVTRDWDVGVRFSALHAWELGQFDYSSGVSIGYKVMTNSWLSVGYNFTGFEDKDFSRSDYTAQGPFIRFRFKFDQNSVREALKQF
jgi:uncharacterized repeat protein (TIGR01451 family)